MMHKLRYPRRQAFTLTEILVVIAIIAVLASLASWAVFAMVGNQKANNTSATIKVVNKVLQSHWQKVIEDAKKDTISPAVIALANNGNAGLDPTGERAQALWIKFRLMEAFPQSYTDVTSPIPYSTDPFTGQPYIPAQQRYVAAYQKSFTAPPFVVGNNNTATQSSACLLMALSVNRGGIVLTQDQLGYAISDTDTDGIREIVDAWSPRNPLVPMKFTRFDTSAAVQAANPAAAAGGKNAVFADPNDPDGTLLNNAWYNSASAYTATVKVNARAYAESLLGYNIALTAPTGTSPGAANYVIPSIVSAGKDGVFQYPILPSDDIISFNLR